MTLFRDNGCYGAEPEDRRHPCACYQMPRPGGGWSSVWCYDTCPVHGPHVPPSSMSDNRWWGLTLLVAGAGIFGGVQLLATDPMLAAVGLALDLTLVALSLTRIK